MQKICAVKLRHNFSKWWGTKFVWIQEYWQQRKAKHV